jgi:hypothetical protein
LTVKYAKPKHFSHLSKLMAAYKSRRVEEDGVRMLRHTLYMLSEVEKLKMVNDPGSSHLPGPYRDDLVQVSWSI